MPPRQTPIVNFLTNWLGVRRWGMWMRSKEDISTRSPPPPNLPPGVNHKLSANYYYSRDARRQVTPPTVTMSAFEQIEGGNQKLLANAHLTSTSPLPTPGFRPNWIISKDEPYLT